MNVNKKIKSEMRESAPDLADKIAQTVDWEQIALQNTAEKKTAKSKKPLIWCIAAACCAVALCVGLLLPSFFSSNSPDGGEKKVAYAVTIEVNPSIRLEVGEDDAVIRQYGLNEDGVLLLHKENYVGQNVDDATGAIMQKLGERGFLATDSVKVCVKDGDGKTYKDKQNSIIASMESYLAVLGGGNLEPMDEEEFERIEKEFKDKNLSEYEKSLITRYQETVLELARQKENELVSLITLLNPYSDKDGKKPLEDTSFLAEVYEFAEKYDYEFDFEDDEVRGKDIYKIVKELADDLEDLTEAIEEIEKGKDEDDYKDLLKDIFKLAEEHLFSDD